MDIIKNLLAAQAMLDALPNAALYPNLGYWANEAMVDACKLGEVPKPKRSAAHGCGAVGCFGGWVAQTPYFKRLGVKCDDDGAPVMYTGSEQRWGRYVSRQLFGNPNMFDERRPEEKGSERKIIEERIQKALNAQFTKDEWEREWEK